MTEISQDLIFPCRNYSELKNISFSLFSAEEIQKLSVVKICESKLLGANSVYDPLMGVIQNHSICVLCKKDNKLCSGHNGWINLPVPICHPLYFNEILAYLNSFCSNCSSLLVESGDIKVWNLHILKG